MTSAACGLVAALSFAMPAHAGDLTISNAWAPPAKEAGVDVPLYMNVKNDGAEPDALMRFTCPVANFTEKRTVDVGEGGLADRAIPNVQIPAHATMELGPKEKLGPKSFHLALLQIRDKLESGQTFTCNLSFRKAGAVEVQVTVSPPPA